MFSVTQSASNLLNQASIFYNSPAFGPTWFAVSITSSLVEREINQLRQRKTDTILQRLGNIQNNAALDFRLNLNHAKISGTHAQKVSVYSAIESTGFLFLESGLNYAMKTQAGSPKNLSNLRSNFAILNESCKYSLQTSK